MFWASRDYAVIAPDWDGQVRGISYSPSHLFNEKDHEWVSPEQIDRDMAQLSQLTGRIRTYTVSNGLDRVPEIARRHGLTVSLGMWISSDMEMNEKEIQTGIRVALANRRVVDRVIVGNEAVLRGDVTAEQLNGYIKRVRAALPYRIKVTTAEPWSTWLLNPELGENVDIIFVHLLPYWEGISARDSLGFLGRAYEHVQDEFPDKPIIIGEAGWPSEGRTKRAAEASLANEAYFIRAFVKLAMEKGWDYYLIEAYDQPWKGGNEGAVGAYWGLFDANGKPKFPFTGMLRTFPEWRTYAGLAAAITLILGLLILSRMPRVRQPGYHCDGRVGGRGYDGPPGADRREHARIYRAQRYRDDRGDDAFGAACLDGDSDRRHRACVEPVARRAAAYVAPRFPRWLPRVSIHVPCYNEPSEMVIETLNALARLDYENYEVIVLDNNTVDPAVWQPVEAHCARLGFRFFHVDKVKGFKAGALNIALNLTDPRAKYIAVIDSDYQVEPFWLRRALPYFASPEIALVQGPQDYRDGHESIFKSMCYEEYRGFFHIGMVERNEHDAIIQHGTMTIVRKDVLEEVGGWSTWCITEDTELGLKLFEAGYSAAYIPRKHGQGADRPIRSPRSCRSVIAGSMAPCRS